MEKQVYSKTIEQVVKLLESYQKKYGSGSSGNPQNEQYKQGYAHAVSDILWMIL